MKNEPLNRRSFLKSAALGAAAMTMPGLMKTSHGQSPAGRPNVIILLVDDMGYGDMSCTGNPILKTPNLDKLHDQSVCFTQFHAAPMCTPTRGQLLTGVDCMRNGARWVGTENCHLRADLPTMPEIFRAGGYRTGMFGKWHVGDNYPRRPQDRGFEEVLWFPMQDVGSVNDYWNNDMFDDTYEHNGVRKQYDGYCTDVWFEQAMKWMGQTAERQEPFFCYIPCNVVHSPYYVKQQYREAFMNMNLSKELATFFGMMVNLDENVGKLDAFLDQRGLADDTIVIFMSDNGGTVGVSTWNAGMKGGKISMWEGGHRVPCFVRWPKGGLRGPGDIAELAQVQDLLPTLIDLCGLAKPAEAKFDGMSLAPPLQGKAKMPERMLVVKFQRKNEIEKWDATAVLWGPWRLVQDKDEKEVQLYNIEDDPHQDHDVRLKHPMIAHKMFRFYDQWWSGIKDQLDIPRPITVGNDAENPADLAPSSWANTYFVDSNRIRDGAKANGYWNLVIDRAGEYEIALRRWPAEAQAPIRASLPPARRTDPLCHGVESKPGRALPIKTARLKMGELIDLKLPVEMDDQAAVFKVTLPAGPITLKTFFYNIKDKELCGAYFVSVRRV